MPQGTHRPSAAGAPKGFSPDWCGRPRLVSNCACSAFPSLTTLCRAQVNAKRRQCFVSRATSACLPPSPGIRMASEDAGAGSCSFRSKRR